MTKICFLADANSIHTRKWVEYFSNKDYEIHIISMRGTKYSYDKNVKLHVIEPPFGNKLSYFFIINRIKNLVKKINPDILHSHYATSYGLYGRLCGFKPFIVSVWGSDVYEFPKSNKLKASLLKYILGGADAVCSTSIDMARETQNYYNKNIVITPFGVNIKKFCCKRPILGADNITIGIAKGLEKIYGIDLLIRAFKDLTNELEQENLRLLIVGDGSEKSSLENLCAELNISDKVVFTGRVDNDLIPDYINKMDIVCLPSLSESFGVTAVEACACGRPVVCTNVGGLKEIVFDDYNGFVVPPKDVLKLKEKLKLLIQDKDKMREFSINARKVAEDKYNWQENASIMEKLYKSIL